MKKIFVIAVIGVSLGITAGIFMKTTGKSSSNSLRQPSSLSGKHQRLFDVLVKAPQGIPSSDEKDLELQASITLLQPLKGEVHFQWVLPDGAQIFEGEVSDSVAELPAGQVLTKKIVLQGVSTEDSNKLVTLQVWMDVDGVKLGGAGVFATKENEVQVPSAWTSSKMQSAEHPLPKTLQQ